MEIRNLNRWDLAPAEAAAVQKGLADMVVGGSLGDPSTVLGVDVSYRRRTGTFRSSAVLLSMPELGLVGRWANEGRTDFPYIPGLLSFREIPPLLPLLKEIPAPDLIIVDGHGVAHPRRLGLASHLGLVTGIPTIGCAKSRLCGQHLDPGDEPGSVAELTLEGDLVGYALRSRAGCRPLFVSPGHLLDCRAALDGVMACLKGYRLPEPVRMADRFSKE